MLRSLMPAWGVTMRLYELTAAMGEIEDLILESQFAGQEAGDLPAILDNLKQDTEEKILGCAKMLKNWRGQIDMVRTEERRLADQRHALEGSVESLKRYVLANMQLAGLQRVTDGVTKVRSQKTPARCVVDDIIEEPIEGKVEVLGQTVSVRIPIGIPRGLEPAYWNVKVSVEPRKKEIISFWKESGVVPDGITIIDDDQTVVVQ